MAILLPVPTSVDSTLGTGDERIALTAVFAQEGVEGLALAVEGALSVTLNSVAGRDSGGGGSVVRTGCARAGNTATRRSRHRRRCSGCAVPDRCSRTHRGASRAGSHGRSRQASRKRPAATTSTRCGLRSRPRSAPADAVGRRHAVSDCRPTCSTRAFAGPVLSQSFPTMPIAAELNPRSRCRAHRSGRSGDVVGGGGAWFDVGTGLGLTYRIEAPPGYVEQVKAAIGALLSSVPTSSPSTSTAQCSPFAQRW